LRRLAALLFALAAPAPAWAQTRPATPVTTTYEPALVRDLPGSDDLFWLLETTEPSINSDRFSIPGLHTGQPPRITSFFSSWTQTEYRIGDADISDPSGSGAPLLVPDLSLFGRVRVAKGLMPIEVGAPGLAIQLDPVRPSSSWTRAVAGSQFAAKASAPPGPPAIVAPAAWTRVSASGSGPLLEDGQGTVRLSGVFAGSWMRGTQRHLAESRASEGSVSSGFAHLFFTLGDRTEVQTIGWVQRSAVPAQRRIPFGSRPARVDDGAAHLQASWERRTPGAQRWRLFASYSHRDRTPDYAPVPAIEIERVTDGPASELAFLTPGRAARWSAGFRLLQAEPPPRRHAVSAGIEIGGSRHRSSSFFSGTVRERVDGLPARIWQFASPGIDSVRRALDVSAYISDSVAISPRLHLEAGLRLDAVSGEANGASNGVSWRSLLPRASLAWTVATGRPTTAFVGIRQSAYRLPLDLLAIGDPAAPTADVFRWLQPDSPGVLVARAGPGTGGDSAFSRIDPELDRPITDEFAIGLETQLSGSLLLRVVGFARRERRLLGLVNTGVPATAYEIDSVPDAFADAAQSSDDRPLVFYNRLPGSFGQDRYLLTNPAVEAATSGSLEISGELKTGRLTLTGGATASRADGPAANRGFGPLENDQDIPGEIFTNPNAGTNQRGRLFADRAYMVKLSAVYRFPAATRLGLVARYQDGQPFSRLTVFPALNQGPEAVRSFPNGGARFMFTGTLDARIQKGFGPDGQRFAILLDAYNVLNMTNEVDERVVTGPLYRTITSIQPPRTVHVGFRAAF
jgi:hypothetical protein